MNSLIFILVISNINLIFSANQNPGHLKPLGSVGNLIHIKELHEEYPTISKLFTYYIPKSEPSLSRQVLNNDKHFSVWQTDKQLLDQVYGLADTNIQVESFKSRQRQRIPMTFEDFLQQYKKEPLIFADNIPQVLQKYLVVPKPLQCEAALEIFSSAILVINAINASPLLFNQDYDHFHCILRGNKRMILINTIKYPDIRKIVIPEKMQQHGPPVNPDRVDFDLFPAFNNVEYHLANLTSGDCLFIPNSWVFQERSMEHTISVIYNIKHQHALKIDANELKQCSDYDATFTLDQIDWSADRQPQSFKDVIMSLVNTNSEGYNKWEETFSKHLSYDLASDPETSAIFEEFYGIIDVDGNGQVTKTEVEQINGVHQHHITDILYEMVKIINKKQKTTTPKSVQNNDEQQSTEDEDSIDSQHDKTDL
ncbi:hypothetical protein I4U23_009171 [Adineta vaga]|nr:hypothetical protein I4U23_009171 [Adineta vaga]